MLSSRDDVVAALGHVPHRIAVAGVSGTGKTTLARRLSSALDLPWTELDSLFHGPGWTPRPEFEADVRGVVGQERWVTEWGYGQVRPLILERAELVVWLDLPVRTAMRQVVVRSVRRAVTREELWNGNVEPSLPGLLIPRDENIVWWAWTHRHSLRGLDRQLAVEAPHVLVVRLTSRADVERWFARTVTAARVRP